MPRIVIIFVKENNMLSKLSKRVMFVLPLYKGTRYILNMKLKKTWLGVVTTTRGRSNLDDISLPP